MYRLKSCIFVKIDDLWITVNKECPLKESMSVKNPKCSLTGSYASWSFLQSLSSKLCPKAPETKNPAKDYYFRERLKHLPTIFVFSQKNAKK
jgi:hypothetical protein